MDRDRNLLFRIFAVQLTRIARQQLNPARDLSRWLADAGALSETDREFVAGIVNPIVRAHDGDVTVRRSFQLTVTRRSAAVMGVTRVPMRDEDEPDIIGTGDHPAQVARSAVVEGCSWHS
jgi:hypothetical protein